MDTCSFYKQRRNKNYNNDEIELNGELGRESNVNDPSTYLYQ